LALTDHHGCINIFTAAMIRAIAEVSNINTPKLTRVCQELEYGIEVWRVTRGAPSNISSCKKKKLFQFSCGCEHFH
jgi:hypothetical protein